MQKCENFHRSTCSARIHRIVFRCGRLAGPAPPPPLRGRRDRMRVPKISGKGVLFVRQSPAREL